ncbi:ribulose-phosphate 3-epimerase [Candidatus Parcubacteria bacterium]|nr:ribulose-phosphate 3-epimerase [Candidatus Parcubacteria bacterium]
MKWFSKDRPYLISASLICGNPLELKTELQALERADADSLHFDVMDGSFVPRLGLYPEMLKAITSVTDIPIDVHLMIDNPEKYVPLFVKAGADLIAIHAEAVPDIAAAVRGIKGQGVLVGVALKPETPLSVLDSVLGEVDLVMLMAIQPGILGQKLIPETMQKISDTREKFKHRTEVIIEIDGGVTPESAPEMVRRGASMLVCGTGTIYRPHEDTLENKLRDLRKTIDGTLQ